MGLHENLGTRRKERVKERTWPSQPTLVGFAMSPSPPPSHTHYSKHTHTPCTRNSLTTDAVMEKNLQLGKPALPYMLGSLPQGETAECRNLAAACEKGQALLGALREREQGQALLEAAEEHAGDRPAEVIELLKPIF